MPKCADYKSRVFESLNNAIQNGYDLQDMPAEEIAADLASYDADLEEADPEELVPFVVEWRVEQTFASGST